jgi:hypothetical protein
VAIAGLALAGPALAAKAKGPAPAAKGKGPAPAARDKVVARSWRITVGGHDYQVRAGGVINYPVCDTVETITPVVKVRVKGKGGDQLYRATIVGPKTTGTSDGSERAFKGPTALIDPPFVASQFSKLAENTNNPHLRAGSYTLELTFGKSVTELVKSTKPNVMEKIKLVTRAGC